MIHLDDDAELYALGLLEPDALAQADEHLRTCDACAARVARAAETVAALSDAAAVPARAPAPRWPAVAAACFALAAAGLGATVVSLHGQIDADGALVDRMVGSHFLHAQFAGATGPLPAKVVYDRAGRWYAVIADGDPDWRVTVVHGDGSREPVPERFAVRGAASVLVLPPMRDVRVVELDDAAGRPVGSVRPVLAAEPR